MGKYNSPFRYPGGKAKLTDYLSNLIFENDLEDGIYIEPYCGGAGAAINLLLSETVGEIIINDYDFSVYTAWYSIVNNSADFIEKIKETPVTIKEWKKQKKVFDSDTTSIFEKGFATFFMNRTNSSGILTGGVIGGLDQNSKYKINARYNKPTLIKRIEKIALYKDRIKVYNSDGLNFLKELKSIYQNKNHFIYLDPPYVEKGSSLYYNSFTLNDHETLANYVEKDLKNSYWMISYDKNDFVKDLYSNFKTESYSLRYSAYKNKKGSEIFIYSDLISN